MRKNRLKNTIILIAFLSSMILAHPLVFFIVNAIAQKESRSHNVNLWF
jgi:ABC-type uncharacterized transport system substrate-binding protein